MTPIFSSTFWALTGCDIHFCIWKLSKFIFMGPPFGSFWPGKYLNFGGESCETYTLRKVKKNRFYLFYRVENKLLNFQGILMVYKFSLISRKILTFLWVIKKIPYFLSKPNECYPENIRKPGIFRCFRGYRKRPVAWMGQTAYYYDIIFFEFF